MFRKIQALLLTFTLMIAAKLTELRESERGQNDVSIIMWILAILALGALIVGSLNGFIAGKIDEILSY